MPRFSNSGRTPLAPIEHHARPGPDDRRFRRRLRVRSRRVHAAEVRVTTVQGAVRPQQPTRRTAWPGHPHPHPHPRRRPRRRARPARFRSASPGSSDRAHSGIGIALSRNRRAISWRVVGWGVGLQLAFAIFRVARSLRALAVPETGRRREAILGFSYVGSEFVFGEIGKQYSSLGSSSPSRCCPRSSSSSALFAILYYLGVMQVVVKAFAVLMNRVMGRAAPKAKRGRVHLHGSGPRRRLRSARFSRG